MSAKQGNEKLHHVILKALGEWTLKVTVDDPLKHSAVSALNGAKLDIFAQAKQPGTEDNFNMLTARLTHANGTDSQTVAGAIDANRELGFIFLSNGKPNGIQYRFRTGRVNEAGGIISGGTISDPRPSGKLNPDDEDIDEDIGTWSATGGGGEDVKCKN